MLMQSVVRAAKLGFAATPGDGGVAFTRRSLAGAPRPSTPPDVIALDIEAVSVARGHLAAFLVGLGRPGCAGVEVEQFLLADPSAEVALLLAVAARVRGAALVTYNGRAFDMRVLGSRCVANGLHPAVMEPRRHDDLLVPARRRYRGALGGCTLRQVELAVLGIDRGDDVPGSEGPARYRAWLRGAPAPALAGVVAHNEADVVSTALLAAELGVEQTIPA